nr:autotransporter outer membrane beta-barrel domain-containing protein [Marinicella sp. W31]MDC2877666.1 autotransporter outer membrane beta-barrel domain-containing protein [Marinicella sp. W31]
MPGPGRPCSLRAPAPSTLTPYALVFAAALSLIVGAPMIASADETFTCGTDQLKAQHCAAPASSLGAALPTTGGTARLSGTMDTPTKSASPLRKGEILAVASELRQHHRTQQDNLGTHPTTTGPRPLKSLLKVRATAHKTRSASSFPTDKGAWPHTLVAVHEAYPAVLLEMTRPPSFESRSGGRYAGGQAFSSDAAPDVLWSRIDAAHHVFEPQSASAGSGYRMSSFELQIGIDGLYVDQPSGTLVGGVTGQYQIGRARVQASSGIGKIRPDGHGIGVTLTWLGTNGFYADAQAAYTFYDSTLSVEDGAISSENSNATGYALSLEAGHTLDIGSGFSLAPQLQMAFAAVDIDSVSGAYAEAFGVPNGQSLWGRAGLAVEWTSNWQNVNGETRSSNLYGSTNINYDFLAEPGSIYDFSSEPAELSGEIRLGGKADWQNAGRQYSVFAEIQGSAAFDTRSYGFGGKIGLNISF